jgi:hypothetical protein
MNLEIGMYVRTINGKIWVITSQKAISGHRKDIINASYNIIDLIEKGDIIKGIGDMIFSVIDVDYKDKIISGIDFWCEEKDIKSIVTREMFESMEYKVKE